MSAEIWTVVCDGGPNDKVVGKTVKGRRQAIAIAKTMIDNLGPWRIVITRGNEFQRVLTEEEALDGAELR